MFNDHSRRHTISTCEKYPLEYTSRLGGVPIGNEKANEVAIVTGSEMNNGWKFINIDYIKYRHNSYCTDP